MSSLEMINFVISSDEYLMKVKEIVDWLKTTIDHNEVDVENTLKELANHDLKFFFSGEHLNDPNMKRLYSLLIKVLKAKGINEGTELLSSLFGQGNPLSQILTGGLPFMDINFFEDLNSTEKGEKIVKDFKILDYMKSEEFSNLGKPGMMASRGGPDINSNSGCVGNHRWLLWQFTLYQGMMQSKSTEEKKLFGHLCSDYVTACKKEDTQVDQMNFGDDSVYELFRVKNYSNFLVLF